MILKKKSRDTTKEKTKKKPVSSDARPTTQRAKFIPNMAQLQKAIAELPDPEEALEDHFTHNMMVEGYNRSIQFSRKSINRGSSLTFRWIYEGKVLIRKRDASEIE